MAGVHSDDRAGWQRDASAITSRVSLRPETIRLVVNALAIAGAFVCAGQVLYWSWLGAWPLHDSADMWLAGRHVLEGGDVYFGKVGGFLVFMYSPPIAILAAPLSLLPFELFSILLFVAQIAALRWICGSWRAAGLVAWLPIVPRELMTGNVDLLVAATILASVRGLRGSGYAAALFSFVKFSPALAVNRRWREFIVGSIVLVAISLPWIWLWPAWVYAMLASVGVDNGTLAPRIPIVVALLLLRRPWSIAAAAGVAAPALYFHSLVLLLPAARLWIDGRRPGGRQTTLRDQSSEGRLVRRMLVSRGRLELPTN